MLQVISWSSVDFYQWKHFYYLNVALHLFVNIWYFVLSQERAGHMIRMNERSFNILSLTWGMRREKTLKWNKKRLTGQSLFLSLCLFDLFFDAKLIWLELSIALRGHIREKENDKRRKSSRGNAQSTINNAINRETGKVHLHCCLIITRDSFRLFTRKEQSLSHRTTALSFSLQHVQEIHTSNSSLNRETCN